MGKTDKVLVTALVTLLIAIGTCLCCVGGFVYIPFRWFGAASGPVGVAKDYLRANPIVQDRLGRDIQFDMVPSGSVNETNGAGKAKLHLGISGSKGKGEAWVDLSKPQGGKWEVVAAQLRLGAEVVPLRGEAPKPDSPEPEALPPPQEPSPPDDPRPTGSAANTLRG